MPHEPTRACEADHCYFHHEDEPSLASAIVCGECGHAYADIKTLVDADSATRRAYGLNPGPVQLAWAEGAVTPDNVFQLVPCCAYCAHDF
jgi:hypothetical protein